ncbi:STAS domain-containing protein [Acuticoccus sp. I52.16.1]|uniref:STAS domain-containing protein n=1 Tax=Acuticoccus sp. I52.16.1 TaxID=2928472 RepID=UPI001FD2729D|nr:STAS domain-containing protein [Acuticoccus sp. I52.16.1]UOM32904.1 STAS domain-containing protein [Acuticoccus sp. I52.16.1]
MSELVVELETTGEVVVFICNGRVDSNTAKTLQSTVIGKIQDGAHRVVMDLTHTNYISSAGLRVILMAGKQIKAASGNFVLCGMQPSVREVFEVTGFLRLFEVSDTRDEAVSAAQ